VKWRPRIVKSGSGARVKKALAEPITPFAKPSKISSRCPSHAVSKPAARGRRVAARVSLQWGAAALVRIMPKALRTPGVAWRTAALLAAAAMLPLAFAAWLSAVHAQALLTAHSHARSAEAARRHAALIQARLRAADAALRERLRQLDWTRITGAAAPEGGRTPVAFIGVLRADGMTRALHGGSRGMPEVPAAARAHPPPATLCC
jgi:hypothetical protein